LTVEWEKTVDIRLIVVDVDGTIAGDNNQVNPAVVQAVSAVQKKGIPVAIGTGRMYRSALRFHKRLKSTLPLIAYNGAWIQDPVSQVHHRHTPISPDLAIDLLDYLEQPQWKEKISLNFYMDDVLYVRQLNAETEFYRQRSGIIAEAVGDLRKVAHKTTKILAMGEDKQFIAEIWQHLQQRYQNQDLYFTQSSPTFFEVTHVEATKGSATQFLAEDILGLQPQNVMAIGDNFNDVSMLTYAGVGVAMGNAPQAVKDQADWVAPSVDLNGVAVALEKFVLI
jgi:Cof subfamily protein (haloacid dehalogenase superfamily)